MAEEKNTRHISVAMFEIFYSLAYICSYYMINDSKKQLRCYPWKYSLINSPVWESKLDQVEQRFIALKCILLMHNILCIQLQIIVYKQQMGLGDRDSYLRPSPYSDFTYINTFDKAIYMMLVVTWLSKDIY